MSTNDNSGSAGAIPLSEQVLEVGARLRRGPSECLIQTAFRKELDDQLDLFDAMSRVDLAHTLTMTGVNVIPPEAGRQLVAALLKLQQRPADFVPDPSRGDLYTNREAWLAAETSAGRWLGAGRARREATTTAFLITVREGILDLAGALIATGQAIAGRARELRFALLPDYTYLQSAQPTTFGHYLLGFAYPVRRDLERLRELYRRVNQSPAGCGSTNGSRLPQDRERLRELLGFSGLAPHARDAMWQADLPIEAAAVLTAILINLDRLAEDLQIFSTEEFALIELDDSHARASKIMPQKKNPFALTHVRGLAGTMIGTLAASATLARTPSGQPDNRLSIYGLLPRGIRETREAAALMGEVVDRLAFNAQRGRSRLDHSFALATDLAEVLVLQCGLDFRQAHRLVGHLVRQRSDCRNLNWLTPEDLATAAERFLGLRVEICPRVLHAALDAETAVASRTAPGGAAPGAVAAMIVECEQAFSEADCWISDCRRHLGAAEALLTEATRACLDDCGDPQHEAPGRRTDSMPERH